MSIICYTNYVIKKVYATRVTLRVFQKTRLCQTDQFVRAADVVFARAQEPQQKRVVEPARAALATLCKPLLTVLCILIKHHIMTASELLLNLM